MYIYIYIYIHAYNWLALLFVVFCVTVSYLYVCRVFVGRLLSLREDPKGSLGKGGGH